MPTLDDEFKIDPANGLVDNIKKYLPDKPKALLIPADPKYYKRADQAAKEFQSMFENSGIIFEEFKVLDRRYMDDTRELIENADFILLGGGHVRTQNNFIHRISLTECVYNPNKVVLGISAGSMNMASDTYAQPYIKGEFSNENLERFLDGLGITDTSIVPHFEDLPNRQIEGHRQLEDVVIPDSKKRPLIGLTDKSYILGTSEGETIYGEAYEINDGIVTKLSENGQTYKLT